MRGFTAWNTPYMGLVDRRPVVCRNLAMGFWVPLQFKRHNLYLSAGPDLIICSRIYMASIVASVYRFLSPMGTIRSSVVVQHDRGINE